MLRGMSPSFFLVLYLIVFGLDFLIDWFLNLLNINASLKSRGKIPPLFAQLIDEKTHEQSIQYNLRRGRFALLVSIQNFVITLLVLSSSITGILDLTLGKLGLSPYWQGSLFLLIASLFLLLIRLPTALYSRFVIEEEFHFNTMSPSLYWADFCKQLIVTALLLLLLLGAFYLSRSLAGSWWWIAAWGLTAFYQFILVIVYPLVIAPLFNQFQILPEGTLKKRLIALTEGTGFSNCGLYVMDGSKRSSHSNAYFTGLGRWRRIVLFDTLLDTLEEQEIEAVLAHEIGHWKHGHIRKNLILSLLGSLLLFSFMGWALDWTTLYTAFGFPAPSLHGLLFCLSFFSTPFSHLLSLWSHRHSRHQEYQADNFAALCLGSSSAMCQALIRLGKDNLSHFNPHPAYSFRHYSHPTLGERLLALEAIFPDKKE